MGQEEASQTIVAKYLDTVRYVATIGARMSLECWSGSTSDLFI